MADIGRDFAGGATGFFLWNPPGSVTEVTLPFIVGGLLLPLIVAEDEVEALDDTDEEELGR